MASSAANRARADLEKQLVELNRLRNANTRDPDFKVWRQATLTLIQRIWEGDDSRSSRFRAVPFTPATTRAEPKMVREWFERGCAEASRVLRALMEEISEHGIIKGPAAVTIETDEIPDDENVPILSLDPGERSGTLSIPDEPDDLRLLDDESSANRDYDDERAYDDEPVSDDADDEIPEIPDPPGARPPRPLNRPMQKSGRAEEPRASKPVSKAPAPPAKPGAPRRSAEPVIPISETAPPGPSRGVTVSNGRSGKKSVSKERLKDMLGFEGSAQYTPPTRPEPPAPARPAPTHSPRPAAPGTGPAAPADRAAAPQAQRPAPQAQRPMPPGARPAEPPAEPPARSAMGAPQGYDETSLQRAFEAALQSFAQRKRESEREADAGDEPDSEDLLGSSPVFSVTAGPVKRGGGESPGRYRTATGIAMAAIATEVEAMGVPGPECSRARATLLELADHFERRDLTWDTVRDAVRLLIAYPVVARRVLPLLVPHLDEAA